MRVNMGREGRASSSLSANGGTMLGSLILANGPSQPLEAATKYYVDTVFGSLNANNILEGILPISSLPAFTGDAVNSQGSNSFLLTNIGVTPGSYAKVIVDAKGRVTGNDVLVGSDIPNFDWSKVSNKPSTIADYGITDALSTNGGTVTEHLSVSNPTQSMSAVNKQYVDSALSGNSAVVGDIIRKPYATTPTGFLRCNGGIVDKTTYADLYAVIGDNFTVNSAPGAGQPWKQQYEFNSIQSTDINNWTTGTALPGSLAISQAIVTKNRVYLLGGHNGTTSVSTVYTAPINTDGTLGTWTTGTSLPGPLSRSQAIVTKNRVYLLGGCIDDGTTNVSTVYTAPINTDGTLGTWTTGTSLPTTISLAQVIVTKKYVYLTNNTSSFFITPINADGTLGGWTTGNSLPTSIYNAQVIVTKNRVYLLGGQSGTGTLATVYTAPINIDGTLGTWTTGISLPSALAGSQVFITNNRVYLFGGHNGVSYVSAVYTAAINIDGTLGTWGTGTSLPGNLYSSQAIVTNNRIYLLGGHNGSGYVSTVYTATVYGGKNDYSSYYSVGDVNYLMPGSGKPWQQQYQINLNQTDNITGWTAGTALPTSIGYSQAIVTNNRVYLLGGSDSDGATTNIWTAAINSDGTLGAWVITTLLPIVMVASQAIVTKNRVYLCGGYTTNGGAISSVYTAPINADGTLGDWVAGTSLPAALAHSTSVITKNRVYLIGGITGTNSYVSTIYTASINNDGTLGAWSTSTSFPVAIANVVSIVTKNRIYILGGNNGTTSVYNTIYTATINSNGSIGPWSLVSTIPTAVTASQAFVTKNRIYLLGGYTGNTTVTNATYSAPINADGTLGTWTSGATLPGNLGYSQLIAVNNKIYLFGGLSATNTLTSVVYTANISNSLNDYSAYYDGSINPIEPVDEATLFALPDFTHKEKSGQYFYMKY